MSEDKKPTQQYAIGYGEIVQMFTRRTAATHAAYLLPHLRSGMALLDIGCGPGSISVGLAKSVDPGALRGLDIEESQVKKARAAAAAEGLENASFDVGDVTALPFDDDTFDVVHAHAALEHVQDLTAALSEIKRVLKPGGILAARDLICDSCFFEPDMGGGLAGMWQVFISRLAASGGHPQIGRQYRGILADAGFEDIEASASFDYYGSPAAIEFLHQSRIASFFAPTAVETDIAQGVATQEQFDEWRKLWDQWVTMPGAFGAYARGEVLARKPS